MSDDDLRPIELSLEDCQRLLHVAHLGASEQDIRILDALRRAIANGDAPDVKN